LPAKKDFESAVVRHRLAGSARPDFVTRPRKAVQYRFNIRHAGNKKAGLAICARPAKSGVA
jgi:hypothetical protein